MNSISTSKVGIGSFLLLALVLIGMIGCAKAPDTTTAPPSSTVAKTPSKGPGTGVGPKPMAGPGANSDQFGTKGGH